MFQHKVWLRYGLLIPITICVSLLGADILSPKTALSESILEEKQGWGKVESQQGNISTKQKKLVEAGNTEGTMISNATAPDQTALDGIGLLDLEIGKKSFSGKGSLLLVQYYEVYRSHPEFPNDDFYPTLTENTQQESPSWWRTLLNRVGESPRR